LPMNETVTDPLTALKRRRAQLLDEVAAIDRFILDYVRIYEPGLGSSAPIPETSISTEPLIPVEIPKPPSGNSTGGTIGSLIDQYETDERSPFHKIKFATKSNYLSQNKRIKREYGNLKLADLKASDIQRLYEAWGGHNTPGAHTLTTRLRGLINFGASILGDPECERVSVALHNSRFKVERMRGEVLTVFYVNAIRAKAHEMNCPSIALAQAFQFDCRLHQKDVIGEWVPIGEQGSSEVMDDEGHKWLRGLRWREIDEKLILRHTRSIDGKEVVYDLNKTPMVQEELKKIGGPKRSSTPIIICEETGLPWQNYEFRRWWRKVAMAAGVPKTMKNMYSRFEDKEAAVVSAPAARS
jgi:hypothetical protein